MLYVKAAVFAVVEGLTEFLPISSTGHLILVERFLRLSEDAAFVDAFMVEIQLPAVMAVLLYFWSELWPFPKGREERIKRLLLWTKIGVAFVPAAVIGFLFGDLVEKALFRDIPVTVALIVGGVLLVGVERLRLGGTVSDVHAVGYGRAFLIGLFQCLALFPGTSRAAATIVGGMALGTSRAAAARFSFFLAIPTMCGATGFMLLKTGSSFSAEQWLAIGIGSVVSFAVAYGVVAFLMSFIQKHSFAGFGYYRIALGVPMLVYFLIWG